MNQKILFLAYLLLICVFTTLYTKDKFPPEEDLVDSKYYEGYREYKNVSGAGQIKLISFLAQYKRETPTDSSFFKIGFHIPTELANKNIDIFVEDRMQKSYYMIPVQKRWLAGLRRDPDLRSLPCCRTVRRRGWRRTPPPRGISCPDPPL